MKASGKALFRELTEANETREKWQEWSGTGAMPKAVSEAADCDKIHQIARTDLRSLETICKGSWDGLDISDVCIKVSALASDSATPYRIRRLCEIEQELFSLGVQRIVDEIR